MIFILPFVLARVFRPTVLDVFQITNFELGSAFSIYGLVAMACYFFGGPLADRFSPRSLITAALITTSMGGMLYATVPPIGPLTLLYGFWGLTTILLFWAALIRATREWGGHTNTGRAFGFLDGGRGLVAALLATISVALFGYLLPGEADSANLLERSEALKTVILVFTSLTFFTAVVVWLVLPSGTSVEKDNISGVRVNLTGPDRAEGEAPFNDSAPSFPANFSYETSSKQSTYTLSAILKLLKMPTIWLQAIIVVCAYAAYKVTDNFSLFARDVFGYDDVAAAEVGTVSFWVRPVAAVAAGLLADRIGSPKTIMLSFAVMTIGCLGFASGFLQAGMPIILLMTVVGTSTGIYALRGVYFALMREGQVPLAVTGSAVGIVSVIGFTPDVFMGPLMGYLLDTSPGITGHQHVFALVALLGIIGMLAAWVFQVQARSS